MKAARPFFAVGHSNRSFQELVGLLADPGVTCVVDIRKIPRSRANPQFNEETLARALAGHGLTYRRLPALGGRRGRDPTLSRELNALWTNESFHNYADYALSVAFRDGLDCLRQEGRARSCAFMCSEAVWWRCHRRIVADYLIASGETVLHIMGEGRLEPARVTPGALVQPDGSVLYPARVDQDGPRSTYE
jgi:uncharacterized protein (DUF488 family)